MKAARMEKGQSGVGEVYVRRAGAFNFPPHGVRSGESSRALKMVASRRWQLLSSCCEIADEPADYSYPAEFHVAASCEMPGRQTNSRFPLCHRIKRHGCPEMDSVIFYSPVNYIRARANLFPFTLVTCASTDVRVKRNNCKQRVP